MDTKNDIGTGDVKRSFLPFANNIGFAKHAGFAAKSAPQRHGVVGFSCSRPAGSTRPLACHRGSATLSIGALVGFSCFNGGDDYSASWTFNC